jgi:hypothetical protein
MSAARFTLEVHDRVHIGPADTVGKVTSRHRVDGANIYAVNDGTHTYWYAEDELELAAAVAARPLLDTGDVDLIIEALGHLAGSQADRGNPTWTATAELQQRVEANRLRLTVLAGAATMTPTPTDPGTE